MNLRAASTVFALAIGLISVGAAGEYLDVPVQPAGVSTNPAVPPVPTPPVPPPTVAPKPPEPADPMTGGPAEGVRERRRPRPLPGDAMEPGGPPPPLPPEAGRNQRPPMDGQRPDGVRPLPPGQPGMDGRPGRPHPGGFRQEPFLGENRKIMELLFTVPQDKLAEELDKLPKFKERPAEEKQRLVQRIQRMFEERKQEALARAKAAGIMVPPGREDDFTRAYFKSRREVEETLRKEMEPRRQQLEKEAIDTLRRTFAGP